jgi:hypothetical protein
MINSSVHLTWVGSGRQFMQISELQAEEIAAKMQKKLICHRF